jgi:radical SAM protein with 4Fe4S-binding SPASM domain
LFKKILDETGPYLFNLNLYFQGEPMMHPCFFSFLERSVDLHTTVATNGHFLTTENAEKLSVSGLNTLIVSLDGMDMASYSSYRKNGNFDLVMEGTRNVAEAIKRNSSSLRLIIQFLVHKKNEHQIMSVKSFTREINASLKLKSMQIINKGAHYEWLPSSDKFRRYELIKNRYIIKNPFPDRCARLWFNPVITWDGKVLPCCFDKDAGHIMGDLSEQSFREIWNSHNFRVFRKRVLTDRKNVEICRNCTSGLKSGYC